MKTYITYILRSFSRRRMRVASLAAASAVALILAGCNSSSTSTSSPTTGIIEANIGTLAAQIGGATQAVALYTDGTTDWTLYTMANRFAASPVGMSKGAVTEIKVPGYIQHITVVKDYGGKSYALLSMGGKGIGVVDVTNPAAMSYVRTMTVDYTTPAYTYSDGGGTVFTEALAAHTSGPVNDLLVDDNGTAGDTTDDQLFIANTAFGIQKTKLSNLMDATADGPVTIDSPAVEAWTLKYSGENPWGGPLSLKMHGGKLYAALGFLGIGIYDPADPDAHGCIQPLHRLRQQRTGRLVRLPNLKPACNTGLLANPAYIDSDGMPTYQQAAAELGNKSGGTMTSFPWAQFDRYGKYYYNALTMDVQDIGGKTIAYIAYALGGLVAVDVTGTPTYLGYVPAVPAHGPDEPTGQGSSKSILSYHGAGMLKDAGVKDVHVVDESGTGAGPYRAYYTDHFAGLVVVSGADNPAAHWKNGGGNFNNNTMPETFWPDYEFVKSYDMTPVLVGDEAVPKFLTADGNGNYTGPVMLASGEINGHGGALLMMPTRNTAHTGEVDIVESSGAGGVSLIDIQDLDTPGVAVASRFGVPVTLASTNEVGADASGAASQVIAIGHAEGLAVSGNYLYLADGPHGMSVWNIADDNVHVVANTLQSEYPTTDAKRHYHLPRAARLLGGVWQRPDQGICAEPERGPAQGRCVGGDRRNGESRCPVAAESVAHRYLRAQLGSRRQSWRYQWPGPCLWRGLLWQLRHRC